jgi:hypothetical protein
MEGKGVVASDVSISVEPKKVQPEIVADLFLNEMACMRPQAGLELLVWLHRAKERN